jgi:secreted trypsin-like serine protease
VSGIEISPVIDKGNSSNEENREDNKMHRKITLVIVLTFMSAANAQKTMDSVKLPVEGSDFRDFQLEIRSLSNKDKAVVAAASRIDPRILGGTSVEIKDAPWQVALVRGYVSEQRSQFCGGSLIAPDTVVTAAHCIHNQIVRREASRVDVVAGTSTYISGGERIKVKAIFIHPKWDATTMNYDIAILKLERASVEGVAIDLSTEASVPPLSLYVTGWGAISEGGPGSIDLLGAVLPLVSTEICNAAESYAGSITDQMLCAGERQGGRDSCQGDSGGPLVAIATPKTQSKLVGVVSFGEGCGRRLKYGVYTRISAVAEWIKSVTES